MSNYSSSEFVADPNQPWHKVLQLVPKGAKVLDIGCSSGNFGEVLIGEKNCVVDGIELDKGDAKIAAKKLQKVRVLNIETDSLDDFSDGYYDVIYFGDVIEHLVNPIAALQKIKPKLAKNGAVIFSVPNMAHISVRLMLLEGKFEYGETGLLDKTHLHYYDRFEVERIFTNAGYQIQELDWVRRDMPEEILTKRLDKLGLKANKEFIKHTRSLEASAYQYIGRATVTASTKIRKLKVTSPPIDDFEKHLQGLKEQISQEAIGLRAENKQLQQQLTEIRRQKEEIEHSTSWRVTKPLRQASKVSHKIKGRGRS